MYTKQESPLSPIDFMGLRVLFDAAWNADAHMWHSKDVESYRMFIRAFRELAPQIMEQLETCYTRTAPLQLADETLNV
jgi:hypothetical protein